MNETEIIHFSLSLLKIQNKKNQRTIRNGTNETVSLTRSLWLAARLSRNLYPLHALSENIRVKK